MSQTLIGAGLVLHGLITSSIGLAAVSNPAAPAITLPSWFSWWPGPFGRSWVFEFIGLGAGANLLGGVLWVVAGLGLLGGAAALLGFGPLEGYRYQLLIAGAGLSLVALALYFHPIYVAALLINVAIIALLWSKAVAATAGT
jgi:hypothetical protein